MEDVFTQGSVSPPLEKQLVDCVVQGLQETLEILKRANVLVGIIMSIEEYSIYNINSMNIVQPCMHAHLLSKH